METKADVERFHRYTEPDPEMHEGGYGTPQKPIYATPPRPADYREHRASLGQDISVMWPPIPLQFERDECWHVACLLAKRYCCFY